MLVIEIVSFGIALWLGLYLVRRYWLNSEQTALIWGAGGLISYSLALALAAIGRYAPPPLSDFLQMQVAFLLAPLFFWLGALWQLRDGIRQLRESFKNGENSAGAIGLALVATLFFALGFGLILTPFELIPPQWLLLSVCSDLILLGIAIGWLDAFEQGESLRPDFVRSSIEAEAVAAIFGGQVGLVMALVTGVTFPMVALLFGVVASALLITVFGRQWQNGLDRLVFRQSPGTISERSLLREVSDNLSKAPSPPPPHQNGMQPSDVQPQPNAVWPNINKHTRTALSNIGNIPKLAVNPLVNLPIIEKRLVEKGVETHTLSRAGELKQLLVESINQLKPEETDEFKAGKPWRHYNSLYYPYVKGLRPYGRRNGVDGYSQAELDALDWFDREVPHRTLYNWQTAASKIIANDLMEQNRFGNQ